MLELTCNLYANGNIVAANLTVWLPVSEGPSHEGRFRMPLGIETLSGAKYHLEFVGEGAKHVKVPAGHAMDIIITEVHDHVAHFTRVVPAR